MVGGVFQDILGINLGGRFEININIRSNAGTNLQGTLQARGKPCVFVLALIDIKPCTERTRELEHALVGLLAAKRSDEVYHIVCLQGHDVAIALAIGLQGRVVEGNVPTADFVPPTAVTHAGFKSELSVSRLHGGGGERVVARTEPDIHELAVFRLFAACRLAFGALHVVSHAEQERGVPVVEARLIARTHLICQLRLEENLCLTAGTHCKLAAKVEVGREGRFIAVHIVCAERTAEETDEAYGAVFAVAVSHGSEVGHIVNAEHDFSVMAAIAVILLQARERGAPCRNGREPTAEGKLCLPTVVVPSAHVVGFHS